MATTQKGIYYNNDYDVAADILEDERLMAESVDEVIGDVETNTEEELANKVDKVQGKGLSTNDYDNTEKGKVSANTEARHTHSNKSVLDGTTASYTTEEKSKLAELENYDDTELREDIEQNVTSIDDLEQRVEDAENNQLTYKPTPATSHYLQDSADSRFRKFIPIGRTTQESTTGKNLLKIENVQPSNGVTSTKNADGSIKMSGTLTAGWFAVDSYESVDIPAGTYTFSINKPIDKNCRLDVKYEDNTTQNLSSISSGNTSRTYTFEQKVVGYFIEFPSMTSGANVDYTLKFQLEQGSTATDYEPYTGGPAPNPNYPIEIKNTGDNGSVNEKVQNKNFAKLNQEIKTTGGTDLKTRGVDYTITDTIKLDGTVTEGSALTYMFSNLDLEQGTYSLTVEYLGGTISSALAIALRDENGDAIDSVSVSNSTQNKTITTTKKIKYIGSYIASNKAFDDFKIRIQLEQGSTATSYVPHAEQNISFPLAQGQKLYEGSYPDDDEKVHHKWGEYVFTGNESWKAWNFTSDTYVGAFLDNVVPYDYSTGINVRGLCTHFLVKVNGDSTSECIGLRQLGDLNRIYLCIRKDRVQTEDLTGIKTYLAEQYANGIPVELQYLLAEEQTEDFTEEQQTAWEQIKKARTDKNITHISSEDETPANVDITYVRDLETVINELSSAIVAQGGV